MKTPMPVSFGRVTAILMGIQLACSSQSPGGGANGGASNLGGSLSSGGQSGNIAAGGTGSSVASGGVTGRETGGSSAGGSSSASSGAGGAETSTGGTTKVGSGGTTSATGGSGPASAGAGLTTGTTGPGGSGQGGNISAGGTTLGGRTGSGGTAQGAEAGSVTAVGGNNGNAGSSTSCAGAACATETVITYPTLPGAAQSPLYTVTANGTPLFVEKLSKFSPEMQVHYAHASLSGTSPASIAVKVNESFTSYTLSPKSKKLSAAKTGNTITFESGPNYLILQVDAKELLFILLDAEELNPPRLGDANVKSIADYTVDSTGATLVTAKVQSAIDAASGATKNILYFPPGKYKVGELWLKSDMTLYLAGGAILYGSNTTADFNTGSGGVDIESCSHGMIRMFKISNTKILGRGVIDGNGKSIRAQNDTKINLLKIEQSSNILIDGIIARDSSFWDTLIYRSDLVTIQNYKMINCRPTTTEYNNTDGVNFDESTNGKLYNAFLYTGDDSMATKNEFDSGTINTKNILHEKVVCYTNSVGCKVGTKTMGQTMDGVVFRDIDVVKAGRALNIDAYDTAVVQNTKFENIRIEAADSSIIALELNDPPSWRTAANTSIIKDTYFTNVSADVSMVLNLHGKSSTVNINGVHFSNFTVQGKPVTSQTDTDANWNINSFVTNITFGP